MILGESIFSVFLLAVPAFSQTGSITVFSDRFVPPLAFAAAELAGALESVLRSIRHGDLQSVRHTRLRFRAIRDAG